MSFVSFNIDLIFSFHSGSVFYQLLDILKYCFCFINFNIWDIEANVAVFLPCTFHCSLQLV